MKQTSGIFISEDRMKQKMPKKLTMESPQPIRKYRLMDRALNPERS